MYVFFFLSLLFGLKIEMQTKKMIKLNEKCWRRVENWHGVPSIGEIDGDWVWLPRKIDSNVTPIHGNSLLFLYQIKRKRPTKRTNVQIFFLAIKSGKRLSTNVGDETREKGPKCGITWLCIYSPSTKVVNIRFQLVVLSNIKTKGIFIIKLTNQLRIFKIFAVGL